MAIGASRTNFNHSRLVRTLTDLAVADVVEPKQSFAERLGQWLDLTDAMSLFSALGSGGASVPEGRPQAPSGAGGAVQEMLARVRAALVESITTDGVLNAGRGRIKLPVPVPGASVEDAADFSPYHRYYLAHQRDMNTSIGQLRTNVREALSGQSLALRRLVELDTVLGQALSVRERNLLSTVPFLLAKRFGNLYRAHREALAEAQAEDNPDLWMQPDGWLAVFCKDMQGVLLAELDLRLQLVAGLVEAFGNKVTEQQ